MYEKVNAEELNQKLTLLANKIKEINNTTNQLEFPNEFIEEINNTYVSSDWLEKTKPVGEIIFNGTSLPDYFFYQRTGITSFIAPNITSLGHSAFRGCTALTKVIAPKLKTIANWAFAGTTKLTAPINLPQGILSGNMFNNSRVPIVVFYRIANANSSVFLNNIALTALDQSSGYQWNGNEMFKGCTSLITIILRSNSVVTISGLGPFTNTPFASGKAGGTLYVPQAQIENYKAATNWSTILSYTKSDGETLQNQILPIEGSIYETQYADGTPISTG